MTKNPRANELPWNFKDPQKEKKTSRGPTLGSCTLSEPNQTVNPVLVTHPSQVRDDNDNFDT